MVKLDGFWDLLLAVCELKILFHLGIEKVKYYECLIYPLLDAGISNVEKK